MENSKIVEIAKKVCPAVITIVISKDLPKIEKLWAVPFLGHEILWPETKEKEKVRIGGGSGFLVSEDGYILTCAHVLEDPEAEYTVILDPEHKFSAKVLERDPLIDVGILKIEGKGFPFLELGDSSKIQLGEQVIAVGNALGEFEDTISAGIVSGISRKITAWGGIVPKATTLRGLIQTDAAINPGNSGGPLINMEGKVIGINTAMVMFAQNIGFAIPINYAKDLLEEVKKFGKRRRPYLGVKYILVDEEISQILHLPVDYGAYVVRESIVYDDKAVLSNSPAEKAGIKENDIILEIDGEKITSENGLSEILQRKKIGQKINLKILREGREIFLEAFLEEKK